jgi:hypothetical protein
VSAAASIEMDKFADINETELKEILENRDSQTTQKNVIKMAVKLLIEFCTHKSVVLNFFVKFVIR